MQRGTYRKLKKKICIGCDHPGWAPCKKINPKRACKKCRKGMTPRQRFRNTEKF